MKTLLGLLSISFATACFLTTQIKSNSFENLNIENEVANYSIQKLENEICDAHDKRETLIAQVSELNNKLTFARDQQTLTRNYTSFISYLHTLEMTNRQDKQIQNLQREKARQTGQFLSTENTLTKLRLSLLLLHQKQISSSPSLSLGLGG